MIDGFSDQQLRCARLLAQNFSEQEVSSQLGVSRSTVQRWKRLTGFREAIEKAKIGKSPFETETQKSQKQVLEEIVQEDLKDWSLRRQELREAEWRICQKLLHKAEEMLNFSLEERKWSFRDAVMFLEISSRIGSQSSELWQGDLNGAIALILKYGYEITDSQEQAGEFFGESF